MVIEDRKFVAVSYELYVEGEDGKPELWETAPAEAPLKFTCGLGMMLEKFEENLRGLKLGDTFDFTIPSGDAYGDYSEAMVVDLDRTIFYNGDGVFDDEHVQEGKIVEMINADGQHINGIVLKIGKEKVKVDFNHPLAGENLNFKGKVLELRDATEEEIAVVLNPRCGGGCGSCGGCGGDSAGDCGGGCGEGHCCH